MVKQMAMAAIKFYQKNISANTPPKCNYVPTCSAFALEAIEKHGIIKGGIMAAWRLLRCNPFSRGGFDPVPDKFTLRREYKIYQRPKNKK